MQFLHIFLLTVVRTASLHSSKSGSCMANQTLSLSEGKIVASFHLIVIIVSLFLSNTVNQIGTCLLDLLIEATLTELVKRLMVHQFQ